MLESKESHVTKPLLVIVAFGLSSLIVVADQFTKFLALNHLEIGEKVSVLGRAFSLVLAKNSGAAFSFLSGATWLFTIISTAVVITICFLIFRVKRPIWAVIAALILAGALGNLIDRLFREPGFGVGHVIDFIYTPWIVPAVYNVADISIVVGMGLYLLFSITSKKVVTEENA